MGDLDSFTKQSWEKPFEEALFIDWVREHRIHDIAPHFPVSRYKVVFGFVKVYCLSKII